MPLKLEIINKKSRDGSHSSPILFVHGAWHGAWCWENFGNYFSARGYECYALSLRGHGRSESNKSLKFTRIDDYVDDVKQVVNIINKDWGSKPILVGHSMGGLVVQKYLESDCEIPKAILLAGVPPHGIWKSTLRIARRLPFPFLWVNITLSLLPLIKTEKRIHKAFFSDNTDHETLNKYLLCMQDESYLALLDMLIFRLPSPKNVQTPMLILGARQDRIFSPDEIASTAKAYGTNAYIFEHMAHDMMLEKNWKSVADYIIERI